MNTDMLEFNTMSEDEKYCYIFTKPRHTAKYIRDAMEKRRNVMFVS